MSLSEEERERYREKERQRARRYLDRLRARERRRNRQVQEEGGVVGDIIAAWFARREFYQVIVPWAVFVVLMLVRLLFNLN